MARRATSTTSAPPQVRVDVHVPDQRPPVVNVSIENEDKQIKFERNPNARSSGDVCAESNAESTRPR